MIVEKTHPMSESGNFTADEFFPRVAFTDIPQGEFCLSKLFTKDVLDPLRSELKAPLYINGDPAKKERQNAGWRFAIYNGRGSAGQLSDHNILRINPFAVGAVDLLSTVPAYDVFRALARIVDKLQSRPREIIYEYRETFSAEAGKTLQSTWLHVGYPIEYKQRAAFLDIVSDPAKRRIRYPQTRNGVDPLFWRIDLLADGSAKRYPVTDECKPI